MMRKLLIVSMLGVAASAAWAGPPQPALAPASWELRFRYEDPQRISVLLPGRKEAEVYWCMLYRVENPTGQEVDFYPSFELVTDTLQVIPSEIRVSPEAFRAIQRRSGDPLLLPPETAIGRLLRGRDRARHGVAIWRDVDPSVRSFTVYVAGLSGEVMRVRNPAFDPEQPESDANKRYFVLRKTLAIPYKLPGGTSLRAFAQPERVTGDAKWIMR
jgi:hypothetical protein